MAKDVEPARPKTVTPFQRLVQQMSLEADIDSNEPDHSIAENLVQNVLLAETEAEMWDADDLEQIGGRNLADVEMRVTGFSIRFSSDDEMNSAFTDEAGRKMYLLVNAARLADGIEFTWNTGAPGVVSKLIWLRDHGKLPYDCVIKSIGLSGAKAVLKLKPVPKRAVNG